MAKHGHGPAPIQRIFLFSDGLVNEGERRPGTILSSVDAYVREGVQVNVLCSRCHLSSVLFD